MKVSFTFLDKEEWSFFATINTIVILIIMKLNNNYLVRAIKIFF